MKSFGLRILIFLFLPVITEVKFMQWQFSNWLSRSQNETMEDEVCSTVRVF